MIKENVCLLRGDFVPTAFRSVVPMIDYSRSSVGFTKRFSV